MEYKQITKACYWVFPADYKQITNDGDTFYTRPNTSDEYVIKECYSPMYFKDFMNYNKNDIVLDAGVNIGAYSTRVSKLVKKVYGYEPMKENYELAKRNLDKNNRNNVKLYNKALVANDDKKIEFYISHGKNVGSHTILKTRGRKTISVKARKFSEVLAETKANKVKMDIEGAEQKILSDDNIDWSGVDAFVMEWHHKNFGKENRIQYYKDMRTYLKEHFKYFESTLGEKDLTEGSGGSWYGLISCYNKKVVKKKVVEKKVVRRVVKKKVVEKKIIWAIESGQVLVKGAK
jgi:FkbM family methyltransferase